MTKAYFITNTHMYTPTHIDFSLETDIDIIFVWLYHWASHFKLFKAIFDNQGTEVDFSLV